MEETTQEDLRGENLGDRVKVLSPGRMVAKRFFRSRLSMVGLITLLVLFLFSFFGPMFSPYKGVDNMGQVVDNKAVVTYYPEAFETINEDGETIKGFIITEKVNETLAGTGFSTSHLLGTTDEGYDVFTQLMLGGRVSLTIGFIVVILETILGVLLGGLAGYFGGWVDNLIMRIVDILSCIPTLPIMLILSVLLTETSNNPGWEWLNGLGKLYVMMAILSLIGWTGTARLVRGQILSLREQEFMLAAKCSGLSTRRKLFKHLLPNVLPQLIVSMTLGLGSIILTEATLGYLNLGAPLGTPTWGALINTVNNDAPWNVWVPAGVCITLAILAFNFVGDGLRDAFDPKMKR
ncbi:MAG: ABC transporter permease [Clostridiales bacterium]|nr:ABC transporter permease [Clostridiales bacterium]